MDASLALNVIALATSAIALLVSALLTRRQLKISTGGNVVPVIVHAFKEVREPDFVDAQEYILKHLASEHSADLGIRALPTEALSRVYRVCGLYEDLGKLVAFKVIEEDIPIGSIGPGITRVWAEMEPYVRKERELARSQFWIFFQHLAHRASVNPPEKIRARLGLDRALGDR